MVSCISLPDVVNRVHGTPLYRIAPALLQNIQRTTPGVRLQG